MRTLGRILGTIALVAGVTVGGVMAGAFMVSPAGKRMMESAVAVAGSGLDAVRLHASAIAVGLAAALVAIGVITLIAKTIARRSASPVRARGARSGMTPAIVMPVVSMAGLSLPAKASAMPRSKGERGKSDRTPRAVQALAQAGTTPAEIAWRTGLPVDAVSMLLSIR